MKIPALTAVLILALPAAAAVPVVQHVDGARLVGSLNALAKIGADPARGTSRVAYSDFDVQGRTYAMDLMRQAKLTVSIDAVGNIVGRRAGSDPTLAPLVTGSHIDTVLHGGNFDGCVGSMSAIEVAQLLEDRQIVTRHPLEFVIFGNEEQGLFGSRAWSGDLAEADLDLPSQSGKTIREGIRYIGGQPEQLASVRRQPGAIAAYLEYHIEQGPVLEDAGIGIGVVEGIVGVNRWEVVITGFANHAGTTPMDKRHDALLSAAKFVTMVNETIVGEPGLQVGTVGRLVAEPNAVNVIAGKVALTLEIRDLDAAKMDRLYQQIVAGAARIGQAGGTAFQFKPLSVQYPAPANAAIRQLIEESARDLGLRTKSLRSGAGHDAQAIGRLAPMGMIFVPSRGGISHSPQEFSSDAVIVEGADVYLNTLLRLDQAL
jgi:N-carbamoyl-L-amino-acid hydrolase